WHHSDKVLLDITANGGVTAKTGMPGFAGQLSADEMAAVLAYIKTFWGPPQIEFQATVTAQDP
ncbi:MAG: cytochrome c, partial [Chloroflexi bacterium]